VTGLKSPGTSIAKLPAVSSATEEKLSMRSKTEARLDYALDFAILFRIQTQTTRLG